MPPESAWLPPTLGEGVNRESFAVTFFALNRLIVQYR